MTGYIIGLLSLAAAIYGSSLMTALCYGRSQRNRFPEHGFREVAETVAAHWAWGRDNAVLGPFVERDAVLRTQLAYHARPRVGMLARPLNLTTVIFVIVYQVVRRRRNGGRLKTRTCIYCPSCSNFLIGLCRRYPWLDAVKGGYRRYKSCNGSSAVYSFAFQPVTRSIEKDSAEIGKVCQAKIDNLDTKALENFFEGRSTEIGLSYPESPAWLMDPVHHSCGSADVFKGLALLDGTAIPRDYETAFKTFRRALEKGAAADTYIGYLYYYGVGVEKNYHRAYFFMNRAAAKGNVSAAAFRDRIEAILPESDVIAAQSGRIDG